VVNCVYPASVVKQLSRFSPKKESPAHIRAEEIFSMNRSTTALLMLATLLCGTSCTTSHRNPVESAPGIKVRLSIVSDGKAYSCNGAVVGPRRVVTVGHCIEENKVYIWAKGRRNKVRVVKTYKGQKDAVVLLEAQYPLWETSDVYAVSLVGSPYSAATHHSGVMAWSVAKAKLGDSGSPIVTIDGKLVGLIWGRRMRDGAAIMERLPKSFSVGATGAPLGASK